MIEKFNTIGKESRLFREYCDTIISKCLENEMNILFILFHRIREDVNVILID